MPTSNAALIQGFATQYGPQASSVASSLGLTQAEVLGQWGLETGWGTHFAGTNNPGNVSPGGTVANYGTLATGVQAYQGVLSSMGVYGMTDPATFANTLNAAGYAQDPNYASSLQGAIKAVSPYANTSGSGATFSQYLAGAKAIAPIIGDLTMAANPTTMGTPQGQAGLSMLASGAGTAGKAAANAAGKWALGKFANGGLVVFGAILVIGALLISQRKNISKTIEVGGKIKGVSSAADAVALLG